MAALAKEAGVEFVASSESVKMFQEDMKVVDPVKDENAGELFDKLLDLAVGSKIVSERTPDDGLTLLAFSV